VRKHRDHEFRCFVKGNQLVAVSQRDTQMYYPELLDNIDGFKSLIVNFFNDEIKEQFSDPNFVFDIYIDIPPNSRIWLVDFNPWATKTDPALFEWNEVRVHYNSRSWD